MTTSNTLRGWLQFLAFAFVLLGAKFAVIYLYGNITPYWDQWDAEADTLYRAFYNGAMSWNTLFEPLNEHRILITRLWNLGLISVNGTWNPLLQMVANAFLHVVVLAYVVTLLTRVLGEKWFSTLLVFAACLFSGPFAWENTLAGIQSMFYFVLFFSFASLWRLHNSMLGHSSWWIGFAYAVLAFLSLASGIFAPLAIVLCGVIFYLLGLVRTPQYLVGLGLLFIFCIIGFALTPTLAHHAPLRASSVSQYLEALKSTLSWPEGAGFLALAVRNFPALFFTVRMLQNKPSRSDSRWYLFVLLLWLGLTCGALAYGRATGSTAPRYLDLIAVFLLVNFACLISCYESGFFKNLRRARIGSFLWVGAVALSLLLNCFDKIPGQLADKRATGQHQETNVKEFLMTGDKTHLMNKAFLDIPYPSAERLLGLLTDPSIVSFLPAELIPQNQPHKVGRLDNGVKTLLSLYAWFMAAGLLLATGIAIFKLRDKKVNATYIEG